MRSWPSIASGKKIRPSHITGIQDAIDEIDVITGYDDGRQIDVREYGEDGSQALVLAYADLPEYGGVISIPGGRWDVGDGLNLIRSKPAEFVGAGRWRRGQPGPAWENPYPYNAPVIFSSTGATSFFNTHLPASLVNAYGFVWRNLTFDIDSPDTTYVIEGEGLNSALIENNQFWFGPDATLGVTAIRIWSDHAITDDCSWCIIRDNTCSGGALVVAGNPAPNCNRHIIEGNAIAGTDATDDTQPPAIWLYGNHGSYIGPNSIETFHTAIRVELSWQVTVNATAGEDTFWWLDVLDTHSCTFIVGGPSAVSGSERMVHIDAASVNNIFFLAAATMGGGFATAVEADDWTGYNTWITDRQSSAVITGVRGTNVALANLLQGLEDRGLITDNTTES